MNEEPRYEEDWDGLLPDREAAWQKMELLLDGEKRRRAVPAWFWRYAVVALFIVGAAIGGWWWLSGETKGDGPATDNESSPVKQPTPNKAASAAKEETVAKPAAPSDDTNFATGRSDKESIAAKVASSDKSSSIKNSTPETSATNNENLPALKTPATAAAVPSTFNELKVTRNATPRNHNLEKLKPAQKPFNQEELMAVAKASNAKRRMKHNATVTAVASSETRNSKTGQGKNPADKDPAFASKGKHQPSLNVPVKEALEKKEPFTNEQTSVAAAKSKAADSTQQKAVAISDSAKRKDTVSLPAPLIVQEQKINKEKSPAKIVFSAGVGLQQSIALQDPGAKPATDSLGRKSGFFDYFPSVYVKAERGRWAVQAEFQYSVPQPTAAFSFSQKTTNYIATAVTETERIYLRKLYYHQLPVSINYQLLPQLSVGAGVVYNVFRGAVMERELDRKDAISGIEEVSKARQTVKGYNDSFFYRTTTGLLVQTDYHWKRFSLGLRYMQNLQPFIKYTQPNGTVADKKNNALQAVLRFRLWRS